MWRRPRPLHDRQSSSRVTITSGSPPRHRKKLSAGEPIECDERIVFAAIQSRLRPPPQQLPNAPPASSAILVPDPRQLLQTPVGLTYYGAGGGVQRLWE